MLQRIEWRQTTPEWEELLLDPAGNRPFPMESGFEAKVAGVARGSSRYVLKTWSKDARPDAGVQYRLLEWMKGLGMSVPTPVAWGLSEGEEEGQKWPVLVTAHEGDAIVKADAETVAASARLMAGFHRASAAADKPDFIPRPELADHEYFYAGIRDEPELHDLLRVLVESAGIRNDCVIHMDLHLANIVVREGRYIAVDWTNGQLGDQRFDYARTLVYYKTFFADPWRASAYRSAYLSEYPMTGKEESLFEAIVLVGLLLQERRGQPMSERARRLVRRNEVFQEAGLGTTPRKSKMIKIGEVSGTGKRKAQASEIGDGAGKGQEKAALHQGAVRLADQEELGKKPVGRLNLPAAFGEFPLLGGSSVELAKLEPCHAESLHALINRDRKQSLDAVRNIVGHLERDYYKRKSVSWGILSPDEPEVLAGWMTVHFDKKTRAALLAAVLPDRPEEREAAEAWIALAGDAVRALGAFLFHHVHVEEIRVELPMAKEEVIDLLSECGFRRIETVQRESVWQNGVKGPADMAILAWSMPTFS
ncbi:phosphotransferase enzyme family protein [Paenibacillus sp. D51F]